MRLSYADRRVHQTRVDELRDGRCDPAYAIKDDFEKFRDDFETAVETARNLRDHFGPEAMCECEPEESAKG